MPAIKLVATHIHMVKERRVGNITAETVMFFVPFFPKDDESTNTGDPSPTLWSFVFIFTASSLFLPFGYGFVFYFLLFFLPFLFCNPR